MARSNLKGVVIVDLYSYTGFKDEIINLLGEEESNKIYDNQEKPESNFTNLLKAFKIIANKDNSLRFIFYLSMLSTVFEDSVKMLDNNGNIVLWGNQALFYHLGVHWKFLNKIHVFSKEKYFASSSFNRYWEKYRLNIDVKTYKPHSLRKILDELSTKNLPATNNNMNPSNAIRNLEEYKALARFRMNEEPSRARIIEESKDSARNQIIEMLASQKTKRDKSRTNKARACRI